MPGEEISEAMEAIAKSCAETKPPEPSARELTAAMLEVQQRSAGELHSRINKLESRIRLLEATRDTQFETELARRLNLGGVHLGGAGALVEETPSAASDRKLRQLLRR